MGRYIKYDELIIRYPILADYAKGDKTSVESFVITLAEADLDGRLGVGFSTPFALTFPIVKDLTFDLCFVKIMFTHNKSKANDMLKNVKDTVNDLLTGKMVLSDGTTILSPTGQVWVNNEDWHPVHSMLDADVSFISSERLS